MLLTTRANEDEVGMTVDLTVVLPCYNAAELVSQSLKELAHFLEGLDATWEILVVDDGSEDGTGQSVKRLEISNCRILRLELNRGKGRAIAEGIRQARGRVCIFTDIDLPYSLKSLETMYHHLTLGRHQAVFGNRRLEDSCEETCLPIFRRVGSLVFRVLAGFVIGRMDLDTQCGLKGFTRELARPLFELITIDRFAFDVEMCMYLEQAGVEIYSVPVRLERQGRSSVHIVGSGTQMLVDIIRIGLIRIAYAFRQPGTQRSRTANLRPAR